MEEEKTQRSSAAEKAAEVEEAYRKGEETVKQLEEDPPKDLADWPDDHAKYITFGGPDGDHSYEEGPETKLGPSGVRHNPDGSVEIDGEKVDDPSKYKGDPIPGGPTDPNASDPASRSDDDAPSASDEE